MAEQESDAERVFVYARVVTEHLILCFFFFLRKFNKTYEVKGT